jgi:hypothetical protein
MGAGRESGGIGIFSWGWADGRDSEILKSGIGKSINLKLEKAKGLAILDFR